MKNIILGIFILTAWGLSGCQQGTNDNASTKEMVTQMQNDIDDINDEISDIKDKQDELDNRISAIESKLKM